MRKLNRPSAEANTDSRAVPVSEPTVDPIPTNGTHLLLEMHGCDCALLDDLNHISQLMRRASSAAGATVLAHASHQYSPQGVSLVLTLAESHFSIHTWPEVGYAAIDFYTCGACDPEKAIPIILFGLNARGWDCLHVLRGINRIPSFRIRRSSFRRGSQLRSAHNLLWSRA